MGEEGATRERKRLLLGKSKRRSIGPQLHQQDDGPGANWWETDNSRVPARYICSMNPSIAWVPPPILPPFPGSQFPVSLPHRSSYPCNTSASPSATKIWPSHLRDLAPPSDGGVPFSASTSSRVGVRGAFLPYFPFDRSPFLTTNYYRARR